MDCQHSASVELGICYPPENSIKEKEPEFSDIPHCSRLNQIVFFPHKTTNKADVRYKEPLKIKTTSFKCFILFFIIKIPESPSLFFQVSRMADVVRERIQTNRKVETSGKTCLFC